MMPVGSDANAHQARGHHRLRGDFGEKGVVPRPLILCLLVLCSVPPSGLRGWAQIDATTVQRSIDRGVAFLKSEQLPSGGWRPFRNYSGGASALCTLALLNAGVAIDDPVMAKALRYLRRTPADDTYAVALQTLVFCEVGASVDLPRIRRNVEWLIDVQNNNGLWSYSEEMRWGGDPSNTQFALLALSAAVDRNIEVPTDVFQRSLGYWKEAQRSGGGWAYGSAPNEPVTGSMTCAGIASTIICEGRTLATKASIGDDRIRCCGSSDTIDHPVARGLDRLAEFFSTRANPGAGGKSYFYYLYALERVGRLTGRRFIGKHDWYREGAEQLVQRQDGFEGFWQGNGLGEERREIATAFALLFLSKGKRQVVVARGQYPSVAPEQWNRHPDSLRQLVRQVERDWGRDLTRQTIDLETATIPDLLQTPVLVISGSGAGQFDDAIRKRLKGYLDQGGTVLFEAEGGDGCGDAAGFRRQIVAMCGQWFPDSPLKRLPPEHPVWYAQHRVDPTALGSDFWVYGIQACCRTPVFVVPKSLSCRWELTAATLNRVGLPPSISEEIRTAVGIGENVIAYATGRELKDKLQSRMVVDGGESIRSRRGRIELAELALGAGGEDAARALPNAVSLIARSIPIAVAATDDPVALDSETLSEVSVLWIHGRTEFQWNGQQRDELRTFLETGGIVFANAVCGSQAFVESFRVQLGLIDPALELTPMSRDAEAFSNRYGGYDLRTVTIRKPIQRGGNQTISRRRSHPLIETAQLGPLTNVFFSPLDISCALESQNSVQCPGYSTEDATKILANLLLFAMQQQPER